MYHIIDLPVQPRLDNKVHKNVFLSEASKLQISVQSETAQVPITDQSIFYAIWSQPLVKTFLLFVA